MKTGSTERMQSKQCLELAGEERRGALVARHLATIEQVVGSVARRRNLADDEREELYSYALEKLVEREQKVFQGFERRSSWRTYLESIVGRLWVDLANVRWGRWRPTALAQRLGTTVVDLDRFLRRDGLGVGTAVRLVTAHRATERSAETLWQLGSRLAGSALPREVTAGEPVLRELTAVDCSDERVEEDQRLSLAKKLVQATRAALSELPADDRKVVLLWFLDGCSAPQIARRLRLEAQTIYRIIYRSLGRLARELEAQGFDSEAVRRIADPDQPAIVPAGALGNSSDYPMNNHSTG